ncbi:MAG: two-component system chemotaxis response regulator CheV [Candidatus Pseudothioglobus sp.]|jgi:two-component system chemotaxis response regulator CheV
MWCNGHAKNLFDHKKPQESQVIGVLESVNQRTQLVGQNRLELLLFRLGTDQLFGINVFKVREVLNCPRLHKMPKSHRVVRGISHVRGTSIAVIDMGASVGMSFIDCPEDHLVIITEYNKHIQGFLVDSVDRIINKNWEEVLPPPAGSGLNSYLTAVTHHEGQLIEIIDVEKIIAEIVPIPEDVPADILAKNPVEIGQFKGRVLVVDDSSVARRQITRTAEQLGLECDIEKGGRAALDHIHRLLDQGIDVTEHYLMVISDVEMPEMDGYTLTAELKGDPRTRNLFVLLHTSLSGVFNIDMVKKVGADDFLAKFRVEELATRISAMLS